jgi:PAS domain S-box-containing protein
LVVATTEPDGNIPAGLIRWLRSQVIPDVDRPYILAIDDAQGIHRQPDALREWDGLVTLPLNPVQLAERLPAIDQWMVNRRREKAGPAAPGFAAPLVNLPSRSPQARPPVQVPPSPHTGRVQLPLATPAGPGPKAKAETPTMSPVEQFQALIDNSPLGMALCDRHLRYIVVNERWKREFKIEGDVSGRAHEEFFQDLGLSWPQFAARALEGVPQRRADDLWIRSDGTAHRVSWELQPWIHANGKVGGVTMTCEVIAPRPAAANKLSHDWEQAGRVLLEGSFAPVVTLDLRGGIVAANGAAANLAGERATLMVGELCFWEVFVEDSRRETIKIEFLAASQESREQSRFAFPPSFVERLRVGQRVRKVAWANTPRYDGTGRLAGVLCFGVVLPDASEETAGGEVTAGQVSPELLNHVPFGLILLDSRRNVLFANREHRALLGVDVEDFADIEHWIAAVAPRPELGPEAAQTWRESVWRRQMTQTITLRSADQSLREIEFRPRPTVDGGMILTLFDVTDRRREEEARRSSEAKFRALFRGVGAAIALEDPSGLLFDVNPVFEGLTGVIRFEARRSGMRDWVHPDDWGQVEQALRQSEQRHGNAGPDGPAVKVRILSREGTETWGRLSVSHIVDHADRLVFNAYFITVLDADREQTADLEAAREDRRALLRCLPDILVMVDAEAKVIDLLPAANGILVADPVPAIGRPLDEVVPGLQGLSHELVRQTLASQAMSLHPFSSDLGEGFIRHFEARFVVSGEGRCVVVIQDITPIHRERVELEGRAASFAHSPDGLVISDASGQIIDWSPGAVRMFGYEREAILQQPLAKLFSPHDRAGFNRMVAGALSGSGSWSGQTTFVRADGTVGHCVVHYVAIPSESGTTVSILGTNREILAPSVG